MTARQQIARLVPLALLVVLAIAGLRGAVAAPRWDGPLRAGGVAIGLALEVVLGVLLAVTIRRDAAARREAERRPATPDDDDIGVPVALRFVLKWVLGAGMAAIAVALIAELHLHFLIKPLAPPRLRQLGKPRPPATGRGSGGGSFHIPVGPILFGLLIAVLIAAVVISIWWAARLRRAAPGPMSGDIAEDSQGLRDAVESGRAALAAQIDDARAAIIACYLAMERTLAERGTARAAADTPDELLARAVTSGLVRGVAARRLTALFYEARFSTHPLGPAQRDAASGALDDLAAELADAGAGAEAGAGRRWAGGAGAGAGAGAGGREGGAVNPDNPWRDAVPELVIAGVAVTVAALAGAAVAGWPGLAVVVIVAAALSLVVLRGLVPRSAAQSVRHTRDRQVARAITGYPQRRSVVGSSMTSRAFYEADLRPVLEHLLAARLAENHGINLYQDPAAARREFCRTRADEALWPWVDPAQVLRGEDREMQRFGIPRRTLARLVNRLEQL